MAVQLDQSSNVNDVKTKFDTREGTYHLMTLSEYSRSNRVGYQSNQGSPQVHVSIVPLPGGQSTSSNVVGAGAVATSSGALASNQVSSGGMTAASATIYQQTPSSSSNNHNHFHVSSPSPAQPSQQTSLQNIPSLDGQPPLSENTGSYPQTPGGDRICFNYGKDLYMCSFRGVKKATDLSKSLDKKSYKGPVPCCHDFNIANTTNEGSSLLVGFVSGQIQVLHPGRRDAGKLYNEERLIDKTRVTCIKWLPASSNMFLVAHASGHMYLYNEELPCTPTAPHYQTFKFGDGFKILTCKSKSSRNPLHKWTFVSDGSNRAGIDACSINEFCFSPCGSNLALVSQDGFLRVFHYDSMELLGIARSYFGGFLCVCWSPDGKYIVVGGEDDLVTVWSFSERRVVARGQGHRSWVSVVAFDPFTTSYAHWDSPEFSDDENACDQHSSAAADYRLGNRIDANHVSQQRRQQPDRDDDSLPSIGRQMVRDASTGLLPSDKLATSYRLGSVSQDTQLCLWDITEDVLRQPLGVRQRLSSHDPQQANGNSEVKTIKPIAALSMSSDKRFAGIMSGPKVTPVDVCGEGGSKHLNSTGKGGTPVANQGSQAASSEDTTMGAASVISPTVISESGKSSSSASSASGGSSKSSGDLSAFKMLTQRLSTFGFSSEKKSSVEGGANHANHSHTKRSFTLAKSHNSTAGSSGSGHTASTSNNFASENVSTSLLKTHRNDGSGDGRNLVSTFDPMKLIGTSACPRFDECPVLEPLVCKKIAHERLTALIFREDYFLTACQDGFVYIWARPGFTNVPHNTMPSSPNAPLSGSGTVV